MKILLILLDDHTHGPAFSQEGLIKWGLAIAVGIIVAIAFFVMLHHGSELHSIFFSKDKKENKN